MVIAEYDVKEWLSREEVDTIKKGTIFEFTINDNPEPYKAIVYKADKRLSTYHFFAVITEGINAGYKLHVQYNSVNQSAHIKIY